MSKIVLDINHIEKQIQQKTAEIEELRELLEGAKKYAKYSMLNGNAQHKVKGKSIKKAKSKRTPQTGISDFVLKFLQKGETDTKDIVTAWATKVNKPYAKVYNSVSNALQRLKDLEKINNKMNEGGRRFGAKWFLKV